MIYCTVENNFLISILIYSDDGESRNLNKSGAAKLQTQYMIYIFSLCRVGDHSKEGEAKHCSSPRRCP